MRSVPVKLEQEPGIKGPIMENMKVTATGYDFRAAHAAMQRYVDGNLLSGFSSAVLVGRDLVDVQYIGWADKKRRHHCGSTTYSASSQIRS